MLGVLVLLSVTVGLPFFVVSATAPLLQKWFAHTGHPAARDPYFLYAASNLGSMLALLGYPVADRAAPGAARRRLARRRRGCGRSGYVAARRADRRLRARALRASRRARPRRRRTSRRPVAQAGARREARPRAERAARPAPALGGAGLVPSSLLLGVTTYITTDIAAIPLLWVVPLALYLLSFILVFARWPRAALTGWWPRPRCPSCSSCCSSWSRRYRPRLVADRALAPRCCCFVVSLAATASWPATARRRAT